MAYFDFGFVFFSFLFAHTASIVIMRNINCSSRECLECIGNTSWIFIVANYLISFATTVLFVRSTYNLMITPTKLKNKYKILIILCHLSFGIASVGGSGSVYLASICIWNETSVIFWQITSLVPVAICILMIIFVERLHDAVKETIWEINNKFKLFIYFISVIQISGGVLIRIFV